MNEVGSYGLPKVQTLLSQIFWLILLFFAVLGLLGIYISSSWESKSRDSLKDDAIADISSSFSMLSYDQSERIRKSLSKWEERASQESLVQILLRDGSIALLVAVFLSLTIELYAGKRLRAEVAEDVLSGVFKKIIPDEIFDEVRSHVIQATALRRQWEVRMSLRRDGNVQSIDSSLYVSTTVLDYKLESLKSGHQKHRIISGLSRDLLGKDSSGNDLPRYKKITIGRNVYEGAGLTSFLANDLHHLSRDIDLPANEQVQVLIEVDEIVRAPSTIYWATSLPTIGATIDIDTSGVPELEFNVEAYHPEKGRLIERMSGRRWEFSGGILPWQAFEITARKKKGEEGHAGTGAKENPA